MPCVILNEFKGVEKMNIAQEDYLYEAFCRDARYVERASKPYVITVNGKTLRSTDTEDLFKQYLEEVNHNDSG